VPISNYSQEEAKMSQQSNSLMVVSLKIHKKLSNQIQPYSSQQIEDILSPVK
jgi:hypothetical protein